MSDEKKYDGESYTQIVGIPEDALMETFEEHQEGFLVKVVIKAIEGDVRTFGPFPTPEEAEELATGIRAGFIAINCVLNPSQIETIVIEPAKLPEAQRN